LPRRHEQQAEQAPDAEGRTQEAQSAAQEGGNAGHDESTPHEAGILPAPAVCSFWLASMRLMQVVTCGNDLEDWGGQEGGYEVSS